MEFGVVVVLVVDLFKDWQPWLLWCAASIRSLQVGPQAVSAPLTADLLVSQISKSSSLLQSLYVCKLGLKVVDGVEVLTPFAVGTRTLLMELYT